jgi:branched-chain amino acid transport system permease protein
MNDVRVQHSNWSSRIGTTIVVIAFVALAAAPWWAERADLRLLAEIYAYVALASLWNLLAGYAGLVSVGQQAYVGLGAYILFALAMLGGVHPLAAIPLAGVAAAIIAVPVAALIFRLRGHYFAIGTWVVAEVFRLLAAQTAALDGGSGTSLPAAVVLSIASSRATREFVIYWRLPRSPSSCSPSSGCCARATGWRSPRSATTNSARARTASMWRASNTPSMSRWRSAPPWSAP